MGSGSSKRTSKKSNNGAPAELNSGQSSMKEGSSGSISGNAKAVTSKKRKKSRRATKTDSSSSSSDNEVTDRKIFKAKNLCVCGEGKSGELIDTVVEYINTGTIHTVSLGYASKLAATEINLQWAICNGTSHYCSCKHPITLTPRNNRLGWKTVRVYIASTYDDFFQERDILSSQVFPELRKWCEERNIRLSDVDLRWGSRTDLCDTECLKMAMSEIDRCYQENVMPFFVSMIGECIGWVPEKADVPSNLASRYGWINSFSVFEMENIHGGHRYQNPNALFMLRDPEFITSLPEQDKSTYMSRSEKESTRVERLKKELKDKLPNTQVLTYHVQPLISEGEKTKITGLVGSGGGFATMITEFLKERIDHLYPLDPDPYRRNPLKETKEAHMNFMNFYSDKTVNRENILDQIEQYIKEPRHHSPLIVTGNYGCGQSTLIAQSAKRTIELCNAGKVTCPVGISEWIVLVHFVGSAPGSTDLISLLERLLKECGKKKLPPDHDVDMLIQQAKLTLEECPKAVIIFIDGINVIDSDQQAFLWRWLPSRLSTRVRMIVSSVEGTEAYQQLQTYTPPLTMISLTGLGGNISEEIIKMRLQKANITLEPEDLSNIRNRKGAETPLWITLACQFIILSYNNLPMKKILQELPDDLPELQTLLVDELESGQESKLVLAALYLILVSRRGLLEDELRLLLSAYDRDMATTKDRKPLPSRRWSLIYNRIQPYLRTQTEFGDGRMDFLYFSFMATFEKRYLSGSQNEVAEKKRVWHLLLADHFKTVADIARKAEELPYHLEQLGDVSGLADCLADWDIFNQLYSTDFTNDLIHYWQKAGGYDNAGKIYRDRVEVLSEKETDYVDLSNQIEKVITFLIQVGQYSIAMTLLKQLASLEQTELGRRPDQVADIFKLLAKCKSEIIKAMDEKDSGKLAMEKEVVDYCRKSLEVRKELSGEEQKINRGLTGIIMTQHLASIADKEILGADAVRSEAEETIDEAIRIFDELDDLGHKADAYLAKAVIYRNIDNNMEEKFMVAATNLCLQVYGEDHIFSARLCKNVAILYEEDHKDLKSAYKYYMKWYRTLNQVLGSEHPDTVMARKVTNDTRFEQFRFSGDSTDAKNEENVKAVKSDADNNESNERTSTEEIKDTNNNEALDSDNKTEVNSSEGIDSDKIQPLSDEETNKEKESNQNVKMDEIRNSGFI